MPPDAVPLFPLQCVLFPRMPLPMHIFEDRYKLMINRCLRNREPFGVLAIREGSETGPDSVTERVGTLAAIRAVKRHSDGRMNLLAVGDERFQLVDARKTRGGYLVGRTQPIEDDPGSCILSGPVSGEVRALFSDYLSALVDRAGFQIPDYELPDSQADLSFVVAAVLQSSQQEQQMLLEMTDTLDRLMFEKEILERDLAALLARPAHRVAIAAYPLKLNEITSGFSRN